ncbi:MAG: MGMT family protein [Treponema sp.]|jgi:methylated-DNA-protein-cysteine methyltransferase-like protein|nr:MGMT family protein [Treponema sp.]
MTETTRRIIGAIRAVPRGKVCCYRDIARAAGLPNGARQVVRVLHSMAEKYGLPWHRIIRADGSIALESCEGGEIQAGLLLAEGVKVSAPGRVDMERYGFTPGEGHLPGEMCSPEEGRSPGGGCSPEKEFT